MERKVSCLACGVGMPRLKRLHHHRRHHGTHVPGAGAPGVGAGLAVFEFRERVRHGLLGDWRTGGSVAVCTRVMGA